MLRFIPSFIGVVLGMLVLAGSPLASASSVSASIPSPTQIIRSAHGSIRIYDTNSLIHNKNVVLVRALTRRVKFGKSHHFTAPNISFVHNLDVGYYDLGLMWARNHQGVYICGYVTTDIESASGPATGNIQAELYINNGRGDDHEYWTLDKDFVNSFAEESPCYNVAPGVAVWTAEGSGALLWADGYRAGTGNVSVTRIENT